MHDTFLRYYNDYVIDRYVAYHRTSLEQEIGRSTDSKAALDVGGSLFHLREHLPKSVAIGRKKLESECPSYGILGDVTETAKHHILTKKFSYRDRYINEFSQIKEVIFRTSYNDAEGEYTHIRKAIVIRLNSSVEKELFTVITDVINFWENYLFKHNILNKARIFSVPDALQPRNRHDCNHHNMNFQMVPSLLFTQEIRMQKYNYETNTIEPIDLSGYSAKIQLYKPVEITISLIHEKTGTEYSRDITLDRNETLAFYNLKSDSERENFLQNAASVKKGHKELQIEVQNTAKASKA